jgi:probable phosphoglycerate mutase
MSMTNEMTRICVVRHGETDWNVEQRMQGHRDLALNPKGLAQAAAVGRYFSEQRSAMRATALYVSDLMRARQTAQPIADVLQLPMTLVAGLRERNFGCWEGRTFAEVQALSAADAISIRNRDPDYAAPGGGESLRQHELRVVGCLAGLVRRSPGKTIVVVTHGGVLDVIFRRANGLPPEAPRDYAIPNAGVNWISIGGAIARGKWQIESWAETSHLG